MRIIEFKKILTIFIVVFLLLSLAAVATFKIMNSRTFQFFGGIVNRIDTQDKVVALTFDDGPSPAVDTILSILNSENVKATFFLIGNEIEQYPEETKKLISAGQEIGNHTYSHNRMVFKSPSYIKEEIEKTDNLIRDMGYTEPIQFRPPYSKKLIFLPYYLKQHDRKTILWDLEPNSFPEIDSSSDNMVKYVVDNVKPGSIILLHPMYDNKGTTIGALKGIIEGLKDKGYKFKTVNELLVQNLERPQQLSTVVTVDPAKAAESEQFFDQGIKLYQQYQYQAAVTSFDKAIEANPANYKVYTSKGIVLCFEGNYQAGMELIQKTLDMKPDYVPAFYDMAMGYKLQKNYDKSLYWFEKTIQGDPQSTWSYYGIATIYADRGNTKDSLIYLEKAIGIDQGVKAVAKRQSHFEQMRKMPEFQALVR